MERNPVVNIYLIGINAKYIHSNLAIRCLKHYAESRSSLPVEIMEFTINQHMDSILREIYLKSPDVLGFSCYIWNYELIRGLVRELKVLLPDCLIFLGGPEVSYDCESALRETGADLVLYGEGENSFTGLLQRLSKGESWHDLPGSASLQNGFLQNPPAGVPDMDDLPFVYDPSSEDLKNRIVYYESSRGCPFSCQYCLSCGTKGVRFRSLPLVTADLSAFLKAGVSQVKFVDRTFNCDKKTAMAIWRFLAEQDNGITNFHFEIAAELLDEEMIDWLSTVRKGLFQFEIGVQSTNPETLATVRRITLPDKLTPIVRGLQKGRNIHLHLDLIAGLPMENYRRFGESFNYVYSLSPDQLQLGFLKVLKGSGLHADQQKYGLRHTLAAPYEVTSTPCLSYGEILRLKMLAEMVEIYYNSCRYALEERYLAGLFPAPFRFYEALGDYYAGNGLHLVPHSKVEYYTILMDFLKAVTPGDPERFQWLAKYDLYSHEKAKKLPEWLTVSLKEDFRDKIFRWFDSPANRERYLPEYGELDTRQLIRSAHIEVFPFHPLTGAEKQTAILFHYRRCDLLGRAETTEIELNG